MSFLTFVVVLFVFIITALLGIGVAFLFMRPSRRQLIRNNALIQGITFFIISLILFSLIFSASTLFRASAYYRVVQNQFGNAQSVYQPGSLMAKQADDWNNNKTEITMEIWKQQMMLPSNDSQCTTEDQAICKLIKNTGISITSRWNSYLVFIALGLTGVFAFSFYSIWILKLKYEEDTEPKVIIRPRPKSKARR
jgi:hypothetical protein